MPQLTDFWRDDANTYCFARNTPASEFDPLGLLCCSYSECVKICDVASAACTLLAPVACVASCGAGCATACAGTGFFYLPCVGICFDTCMPPCITAATGACAVSYGVCLVVCELCELP